LRKPSGANVKLGTFVLLVILVAIAFGGAGYLYGINAGKTLTAVTATPTASVSATTSKTVSALTTSTTNATADWKTYTNSTYGYSFKHPDLAITKCSAESSIDECISVSELYINLIVSADFQSKKGDISLKQYADDTITPKDKVASSSDQDYKIGSYDGLKRTVESSDLLVKGAWYFVKNSSSYVVIHDNSEQSTKAELAKTSETVKTILSTFQFTK